jgi:aminotransferase
MSPCFDVNPNVSSIPHGDRLKIMDATWGRTDLADLSSGNPNMPMAVFIRERLKAALDVGYAPYTDFHGLPELRERISQYLKAECEVAADPETEIVVTHGVQEALYVAMRTILLPGDEILIPSPHYGNYYFNTVACGARPVLVPLGENDGFQPDCKNLAEAISPRTKALVFSNPSNPLGVLWSRPALEEISHLAEEHNLILFVDEIYRDFYRSSQPVSIAALPGMKERTFTFNGFSKAYIRLIEEVGVVTIPGTEFGPTGDGYLRLSVAAGREQVEKE